MAEAMVAGTGAATPCVAADMVAGMAVATPFAVEAGIMAVATPFAVEVDIMAAARRCAGPECILAAGTMAVRDLALARQGQGLMPDGHSGCRITPDAPRTSGATHFADLRSTDARRDHSTGHHLRAATRPASPDGR